MLLLLLLLRARVWAAMTDSPAAVHEKLRSKHIRTLEALQAMVREQESLKAQVGCRSSMTLELASSELEKVNSYRAPVDKAQCVVRCCSFLFNQLSVNRNDKDARPGADDFLPVFIYVVLHSSVSQLHANIDYVSAYRNPQALMSKSGYCLVNLQSALAFLENVSARSLTGIDQAGFETACRDA